MFATQRRPNTETSVDEGAQAARRIEPRSQPAEAKSPQAKSSTATVQPQAAEAAKTTEQSGVFQTAKATKGASVQRAKDPTANPPMQRAGLAQLRSKSGPTVAQRAASESDEPTQARASSAQESKAPTAGYTMQRAALSPDAQAATPAPKRQRKARTVTSRYSIQRAALRKPEEPMQAARAEGSTASTPAQLQPAQRRATGTSAPHCEACHDAAALQSLGLPAAPVVDESGRRSSAFCEPCSSAADRQSSGLPRVQRMAMPERAQQPRLEKPTDVSQLQDQDPSQDPAEQQADQIGERIGRDLGGVSGVKPGPIDSRVQSVAERHLGVNMAGAELRSDRAAADRAESMEALAVTEGSTVSFASGQMGTGTNEGRSLLGHELTHVAQQREHGMAETPQRQPAPSGGAGAAGNGASAGAGGAPGADAGGGAANAGAGGAPAPAAVGGEAGASAPAGDGLLMPEPSLEMSEAERARIEGVDERAGAATDTVTDLPSAGEQTGAARSAVEEPQEETKGRAESALAAALGGMEPPDPEVVALCDRIRADIRANRPPTEEAVYKANPKATADRVGKQVSGDVKSKTEQAAAGQEKINEPAEGQPLQQPVAIDKPPERVETPDLNAEQAAPDKIPEEQVSLDADVAAQDKKLEEAGMTTEPAKEATKAGEGPLAEASGARGELGELAKKSPQEVLAEQQAAIEKAEASMAGLQANALAALEASRAATVSDTSGQQDSMVGTEEDKRKAISKQARDAFTQAQTAVNAILRPLPNEMEQLWKSRIEPLSTRFEADLAQARRILDDRYSGFGGFLTRVGEFFTGVPQEIRDLYTNAERNFADGVCQVAQEISSQVNTLLKSADEIIDNASKRIDQIFQSAGPELAGWAEGEKAKFQGKLTGLKDQVQSTRTKLKETLLEKSSQTIHEARLKVQELREQAKGLLERIADAAEEFAENPGKFILEGLLKLVGIPPPAFWALIAKIGDVIDQIAEDPMKFANAAATALKQGFQMFFDNIGTHLLQGFVDWLFSAMGNVGVSLPADTSLKSMITFFLQLMGLSWANIRKILAKHIGEENVALIEKAWELISDLIAMGPQGLFELIKEKLDPQTILDTVIDAAIDFIVQTVVTQAAARIVALFNPVGAIAQAVEAIYRVLKWVFTNAARIFTLVETVVNGVADLLAGNTGGLASAIEKALAGLIPSVIDFIADYIGLGDLPEKIAGVIGGLQERVLAIVDQVIGFLVEKAKGLLKALGLGGDEEEEKEVDPTDHAAVANKAANELEAVADAGSYAQTRTAAESRAKELEVTYSAMLEEGIGLSIRFEDPGTDTKDQDIDATVSVAPNTTTAGASISAGARVEKKLKELEARANNPDEKPWFRHGYKMHAARGRQLQQTGRLIDVDSAQPGTGLGRADFVLENPDEVIEYKYWRASTVEERIESLAGQLKKYQSTGKPVVLELGITKTSPVDRSFVEQTLRKLLEGENLSFDVASIQEEEGVIRVPIQTKAP